MNVGGGEAADQLVRMMLSFGEIGIRLGGSALKNALALTLALAKNNKSISGKINLARMLRQTRDLRRFPMTPQQYKQFKKLAKKHKLLFSVIRDKDERGKLRDVILPVTELERANAIFERILYTTPQELERKPARELQQGRDVFQPERRVPEMARGVREHPTEPPMVREARDRSWREVMPPKKGSRSGQGSRATKPSFSTPKRAATTRTASDRPSVEGRLKAYRAQLDQKRTPVPTRTKTKVKSRPKSR